MGMTPVASREFSEEVALEEEDDDLIVVTKREKDPARALTDPRRSPRARCR
ncbi:MAG: hypothetical protein H6740_05420 [Alphaproteobacteria bacterium]|nr:hypothetical protein [Alphaproteobacteria bacterium]